MLTGDDGLPLTIPPAGYPIAFPENGLLVDDPGHALDLTAAVRAVFDEVFKASADTWWNDVEALLDPKGHDLRAWLAASFFEHHLKRHSKSRRKAPIIWQLAVPSGRYSIWLYAHRVSRDSFIQIQNDIVSPKLGDEERRLASLIQSAGANPTSKESKEIETQEAFVGELRDLLDKVKRVAPLWRPTLDDGVVLTMARSGSWCRSTSLGRRSSKASGMTWSPESMTGRISPCISGPSVLSLNAPRIAVSQSLTALKTSSGSRMKTANGSPERSCRSRSTDLS